jgi:hypothetical protein
MGPRRRRRRRSPQLATPGLIGRVCARTVCRWAQRRASVLAAAGGSRSRACAGSHRQASRPCRGRGRAAQRVRSRARARCMCGMPSSTQCRTTWSRFSRGPSTSAGGGSSARSAGGAGLHRAHCCGRYSAPTSVSTRMHLTWAPIGTDDPCWRDASSTSACRTRARWPCTRPPRRAPWASTWSASGAGWTSGRSRRGRWDQERRGVYSLCPKSTAGKSSRARGCATRLSSSGAGRASGLRLAQVGALGRRGCQSSTPARG